MHSQWQSSEPWPLKNESSQPKSWIVLFSIRCPSL